MIILGLNAYHGDSAACLVADGRLVAAAEEERFRRVKHWAGFPAEAVRFCLQSAGIGIEQVDHVAANRDPRAHILRKILFLLFRQPSLRLVMDRMKNAAGIRGLRLKLAQGAGVKEGRVAAPIHSVEHHRAHLASAFFVSPFEEAAVVSVDGFGDFVSAMWGDARGGRIAVKGRVNFPHSLGLFYLAMTQYLGFENYGDEYKAMGLAACGEPTETEKVRRLVKLMPQGGFALALDYFLHGAEGISMNWEDGGPRVGRVFSSKLEELLGPRRRPDDPILETHRNIAASMQAVYEEAFFHLLRHVHERTNQFNLCLAGGCAMNSVANGKIFERTPFRKLYIQCAPGDAGGAIGAAYYVWNQVLGRPRSFVMNHGYWGPGYDEREIQAELEINGGNFRREGCAVEKMEGEDRLCLRTARAVAGGKVVGWFQGRMEWGPRALGNRSILCDPRRADMKDTLNVRIKRRESFRPFAPSVLAESASEWFAACAEAPFMAQVYPVRREKRKEIPAVTHVNGSGRLHTVAREANPRFHRLISCFAELTGVPMLLNTSFNENEPIVRTPREAIECFLRTRMDVLVLNDFYIERVSASAP